MKEKSPTTIWCDTFRREFRRESDRASVILAGAMIEKTLEMMIKAKLIPSLNKKQDELFDTPYAPLRNFKAMIELAYRIGLISSNLCRDLNIIRDIRNDFAHDIEGCSFKNRSVKQRIGELMKSSNIADRHSDSRAKFFPKGPRGDFEITISWILWNLSEELANTQPIKSYVIEFGYL
jgi:hypothetical protein